MSLKQEDKVPVMLASLKLETEFEIVNLPIVCEFLDISLMALVIAS